MKIKLPHLLYLALLLTSSYQASPYNLTNGSLIPELSNSKNECITKLSDVLGALSTDEQKLFESASQVVNDQARCFDIMHIKNNLTTQLKSMNAAYGEQLGNGTNKQIKSLECLLSSAKVLLDDSYYMYIQNELARLTPYGSYPQYTSCLANFVQNVNYILMTRRRYLLTTGVNIDKLGLKDANGKIKGFPWKIKERSVIVNEFVRLQYCINNYTTSFGQSYIKVKEYFANSKMCSIHPGLYDFDLFGTINNYDLGGPQEVKEVGSTVGISANSSDLSKPTPKKGDNKVEKVSEPPMPATNSGIIRPPINPPPKVEGDPKVSMSSIMPGSYTNPNTDNDPCLDWEEFSKTYKPVGMDTSPSDTRVPSTAPTSALNSSPPISASASIPSAQPTPDRSPTKPSLTTTETNSPTGTSYSKSPQNANTTKFCPNLIGKDLSMFQLYSYSPLTAKNIFSINKSLINLLNTFSTCANKQVPVPELIKYINSIKDVNDKLSESYITRNLINDMKSQITDTDGGFVKLLNLMQTINSYGIANIKDFNFSCSDRVCNCPDCPSPIKTAFSYLSDPLAPGENLTTGSITLPNPNPAPIPTTAQTSPPTPNTTSKPASSSTNASSASPPSNTNPPPGSSPSKPHEPASTTPTPEATPERFIPDILNAYLSKCGDTVIFLAIQKDKWASSSNFDLRYYNTASNRFVSALDDTNKLIKSCSKQNLRNEILSGCSNDYFAEINAGCRAVITDNCGNLQKTFENMNTETLAVSECDISLINIEKEDNYETFKTACFNWINSNLIDSTLTLNVNNMINLMNIISKGSAGGTLRFLSDNATKTSSAVVNDSDDVDSDKDTDISAEAALGSSDKIDIDGSKYYYEMMRPTYPEMPGELMNPLPPKTADMVVPTSAAASVEMSRDSQGSNSPPTLTAYTGSKMYDSGLVVLIVSLFLI
jgi:hypothetical protein